VAFTVRCPDPFAVSGKVVAVRIFLIPPAPSPGIFCNVKVQISEMVNRTSRIARSSLSVICMNSI